MVASSNKTGGGTLSSVKKVNEKKQEIQSLIYIGPTLPNLVQYSAFTNGMPKYIESKFERCPQLRSLFLPIEDFPDRQNEVSRIGSELNTAYETVLQMKGV